MAVPGRYRMVTRLLATAYPAIEAVPSEDTRLCRNILPNWNMPLSRPPGMPMERMFLIMPISGTRDFMLLRRMELRRSCIRTNIMAAAMIRLSRVE